MFEYRIVRRGLKKWSNWYCSRLARQSRSGLGCEPNYLVEPRNTHRLDVS